MTPLIAHQGAYWIMYTLHIQGNCTPLLCIWGYSGDLTQPNVKYSIVGQTYRVKSPLLAPVATRDLLGI